MKPQNNRGFTLVELLVAVTLLSIAMTAIYGLLYSTISAWRLMDRGFNAPQQARLAFTILRRDIESTTIRAEHLFEGDDNSVTLFVINEPMDVEQNEGRRLMRVRYRYRPVQNEIVREEAMVQTALPNRPPAGKKVDAERVRRSKESEFVIARDVEEFEIRYLWAPFPKLVDPNQAPPPVKLIETQRHRENLGLPTGIELRLVLRDPEDNTDHEFRQLIRFPLHRERLPEETLMRMLEGPA